MTKIHLQSTYSDIVSDGGLDPRNKYEKMAERHTKALVESMKQTISEHMQGANVLPPTLEWIGLTGVEVNHIFAANVGYPERMMKEVEAKLKDKNT